MPNDNFPLDKVRFTDKLNSLNLDADQKAFVRFSTMSAAMVDCPIFNRIVVGPDRLAVGAFHEANPNIPTPRRVSGTSRLGFGEIVSLGADGTVQNRLQDKLFMIADFVTENDTDRATRVVTANEPDDMDDNDQDKFADAQANCTAQQAERFRVLSHSIKAKLNK